jgi:hypothetical protein
MPINKFITLLLFTSLVSCQPKEKFDWEIGISAPKYYSSSPKVQFFYHGNLVHSVSSNVGIQPGWGETAGGYASGKEEDEVPDSLHVEWLCGTDRYYYQGDFPLPRAKMLKLFQNPVKEYNGLMRDYTLLIVGTAPGGNVTLWMRAGSVLTEIQRFKAKSTGIWKENDNEYNEHRKEIKTSSEFINSEYNTFHYLHGIPYKVWEEGEKEYEYDVGFTSESADVKMSLLTFFSKSGAVFQPDTYSETPFNIDKSEWSKVSYMQNNNVFKKKPLPIMMRVQMKNKLNPKLYYATDVILPINFKYTYTTKYLDTVNNKKENYNRIVIGIYSDCKKGIVWLEGKNKRLKIMDFKCFLPKMDGTTYTSGGYSLPKDFEFPKWEGREQLIKPDIEFWQEK